MAHTIVLVYLDLPMKETDSLSDLQPLFRLLSCEKGYPEFGSRAVGRGPLFGPGAWVPDHMITRSYQKGNPKNCL